MTGRSQHTPHLHLPTRTEIAAHGVGASRGGGNQCLRWRLLLPLAVTAALALPGTPARATDPGDADNSAAPTETVEWSKPKTLPDAEDGTMPKVAISADGTRVAAVWHTSPGGDGGAVVLRAAVARNGGAKWKQTATVAEASNNFGAVQLLMSDDGSRLTAAWTQRQGPIAYQALASSSDDGGKTWTSPTPLTPEPSLSAWGSLAASADGRAVVALHPTPVPSEEPAEVRMVRSADGGRTWSNPTPVATLPEGYVPGGIDVAASSDARNLFAVWTVADAASPGRGQVWAAQSQNGGDDWSQPAMLSDPTVRNGSAVSVVAAADGSRAAALWTQFKQVSQDDSTERIHASVWRPQDGWSEQSTLIENDSDDGRWLAVAPSMNPLTMSSNGSNLAAAWQRHERPEDIWEVSISSDGGSSWSQPLRLGAGAANTSFDFGPSMRYYLAPDLSASADGARLTSVWGSQAGTQSATSIDGGRSWSAAEVLAESNSMIPFPSPQVAVSGDGSRSVAVWSGTTGEGVSAAFSPVPRTTVKAKPRAGRSKLKVRITPDIGANKQWKFLVKKRTKNGKWRKVKNRDGEVKIYKTRTPKHRKIINLPKGKYKARSKNSRGYKGTSSDVVRLRR